MVGVAIFIYALLLYISAEIKDVRINILNIK
jgi:hypothetical protein